MSDALECALAALDQVLQRSPEASYGTDLGPDTCARCQRHRAPDDGDLCAACRAWLLGDGDDDPVPVLLVEHMEALNDTVRRLASQLALPLEEVARAIERTLQRERWLTVPRTYGTMNPNAPHEPEQDEGTNDEHRHLRDPQPERAHRPRGR